MKLKRTVIAPALVAGVALVSGGWLLQQGASGRDSVFQRARTFEEVMGHVREYYVDPQTPSDLYQKATEGMLEGLGDPHTSFLTPEQYADLRVQTTGEFAGLGIHISKRDDWVTAVAVVPGSPAERAGVRVGDRMIRIGGESTEGWDEDVAVKKLRGPKGTTASIQVLRVGVDEPIDFRIERDFIHVKSVPYAYMVDDQVGYLNLILFSETSTDEIRAAIDRLRRQGMRKLILDLRNNPGGLLDQGASVADLFLPPEKPLVETRGRNPRENEVFRSRTPESYPELTLAVLVDEYSASAAEIVAGALQDHDRALVLGATSYGKGSVQSLFPLSGGGVLKMTTARWYTPSGRSIQKERPEGDAADAAIDQSTEVSEDGTPIRPDTVAREAFRTSAGRVVYGGGGIVPDLILANDTATAEEKEFFRVAARNGSKFYSVLFRYGVEYARDNPGLRRDFPVTQAMLDEFFRRLQAAGVELTREQYAAGRRYVAQRLVDEIATAKFGLETAAIRDDASDTVLREAARLLRAAPTQAALFRTAEERRRNAAAARPVTAGR